MSYWAGRSSPGTCSAASCPTAGADALTAPVLRLALGDHARYGLRRPERGPLAQVIETGRVPIIDVGALAAIRAGRIGVRPGPERFEGATVRFADGSRASYDAVLLATGYAVDLRGLLPDLEGVLDASGRPLARAGEAAAPGLYLMGYHTEPNGHLRATSLHARAIAADAARRHGLRAAA